MKLEELARKEAVSTDILLLILERGIEIIDNALYIDIWQALIEDYLQLKNNLKGTIMQEQTTALSVALSTWLQLAGYPQRDSMFYWVRLSNTDKWELKHRANIDVNVELAANTAIAAPIASEIITNLPAILMLKVNPLRDVAVYELIIKKYKTPHTENNGYPIYELTYTSTYGQALTFSADTLVEAAGYTMLWALKEKHINF